ncbi:NAD(P)/FAD-dependent oxidoreductase [Pseudomonas sp. R1-18]|uniref:NAD(P)/FAD-dependent oxidoreductase n=1 Tax=Pseudomonas sp. R1-18 TaxID=1632772 RepID=UPI003DA98E40
MSAEAQEYAELFDQPESASVEAGHVDLDCLIIGAGPAGLTTAIYLSRFHRHVLVADGGNSRAGLIPVSHNYPGFPPGISGENLLARLREQAAGYGARIESGRVEALRKDRTGFVAQLNGRAIRARRVVLATGMIDAMPDIEGAADAIARRIVRLCPICDGYEVNGDNVAVYGEAHCAISHALFLRNFTDRVTVFAHGDELACDDAIAAARHAGILIVNDRIERIEVKGDAQIELTTCNGKRYCFDIFYSSLGSRMSSELAVELGAEVDEEGALLVDAHKCTSVPGLYAVGDVVNSLKQISVATGDAAICATAVHNSLEIRLWQRARDQIAV